MPTIGSISIGGPNRKRMAKMMNVAWTIHHSVRFRDWRGGAVDLSGKAVMNGGRFFHGGCYLVRLRTGTEQCERFRFCFCDSVGSSMAAMLNDGGDVGFSGWGVSWTIYVLFFKILFESWMVLSLLLVLLHPTEILSIFRMISECYTVKRDARCRIITFLVIYYLKVITKASQSKHTKADIILATCITMKTQGSIWFIYENK